ncbi:kinesin motor domain-containing protein [Cystoisospora suis]|uniref:Kinesin motor domain-containing protein n=1 Tax=Cystoisospora suis TaxID=483139 RepID=A0A2C6LFM6_9APIC|nr:kinesin motor domain-containing protein [Cystoisospora suis]
MNVVSSRSHAIFALSIESYEVESGAETRVRTGKLNLDSLGGNTRTAMIANIGPADCNYDETLSTLRYAHRAKNIRNKPRLNDDPKDAMLRAFQEEISKLRAELAIASKIPRSAEWPADGAKRTQTSNSPAISIGQEPSVPSGIYDDQMERLKDAIQEKHRLACEELEREKRVGESIQHDLFLLRLVVEPRRHGRPCCMPVLPAAVGFTLDQMIEEARNIAEEERKRLSEELRERVEQQEAQRQSQEELVAKLKVMESKITAGSQVMQQAVEQEKELRKAQVALERQRQKGRERVLCFLAFPMEQDLIQQQTQRLQLEEKFNSREEQIVSLTSRLEKLWQSFRGAMAEIDDLQQEFQAEREDLLDTIRRLIRDVKFQATIVSNFIPEPELAVRFSPQGFGLATTLSCLLFSTKKQYPPHATF